jgi:hypothetical protein
VCGEWFGQKKTALKARFQDSKAVAFSQKPKRRMRGTRSLHQFRKLDLSCFLVKHFFEKVAF